MRKFFYLVNFSYILEDGSKSEFDLGVFSTLNLARKKILQSSSQTGFKEFTIDNFEIIKFGVEFNCPIANKSDVVLYCVTHEYIDLNSGDSFWTIFDYLSTKENAQEMVNHLKMHSRLGKKHPQNFSIIEVPVDNFNSWSEGFTS